MEQKLIIFRKHLLHASKSYSNKLDRRNLKPYACACLLYLTLQVQIAMLSEIKVPTIKLQILRTLKC